MTGFVNIDKPQGMTSHDVVAQCRRIFNTKKIGHLGTLDPMATGVLPIAVGPSTRLIQFFPTDKAYLATIRFGLETLTLDAEGEVLKKVPCLSLTELMVNDALTSFRGLLEQRVPRHASVHYKGKKLYHYVQKGVLIPEEDLPVRTVEIRSIHLQSFSQSEEGFPEITLSIACSSGTYIRSIARDLGRLLTGMPATLTALRRTNHGYFLLERSVPLETLQASTDPTKYLQSADQSIGLPILDFTDVSRVKALLQGMKLPIVETEPHVRGNAKALARYIVPNSPSQRVLGVVECASMQWKPVKLIATDLLEHL